MPRTKEGMREFSVFGFQYSTVGSKGESDFDLSRGDYESGVLRTGPGGKFNGAGFPAVMNELPAKGAIAGDRAGELKPVRVVTCWHVEARTFFGGADRSQFEKAIQDRGRIGQDVAGGGSNLFVAKLSQRLQDQIDQTGFALQRREERNRLAAGRLGQLSARRLLRFFSNVDFWQRAAGQGRLDLPGSIKIAQGGEERAKGHANTTH